MGRGRLAPLRGRMPRPTTQRNFQGKKREDRAGPRLVVRRALRRGVFRMRFWCSNLVWTTPRLRPPRYPGPTVRAYARRTCRSGVLERLVREGTGGSSWGPPNERCAATPATAIALRTSEQWVLKRHPTVEAFEESEKPTPHLSRYLRLPTRTLVPARAFETLLSPLRTSEPCQGRRLTDRPTAPISPWSPSLGLDTVWS
jgi:hypothetical protein